MDKLGIIVWALFVNVIYGQKITVNVDSHQAPHLAEFGTSVKRLLEEKYFLVRNPLYTTTYKEPGNVTIQFQESLEGVNAYTYPTLNKVIARAGYYSNNPNDTGSLVHEFTHIVQQYKKECPGWIYEGVADYIRYYLFETEVVLKKPMDWAGEHYSQGYRPAAYLFWWFHQTNRSDRFFNLHMNCRANGKPSLSSMDKDWEEMIYSEAIGGFKTNVIYDGTDLKSETKRIKDWYEKLYPKLKDALFSPTFEELDIVDVYLDEDHPKEYVSVAPTQKDVKGSPQFLRDNKPDITEFLYALARIIQQYKGGVEWLTIGIARLVVIQNYYLAKQQKPSSGNHYTDGNYVAAYFLNWLDKKYKPEGQRLTYWLNKNSREGSYTEADWITFTDKSVDQLWEDFKKANKI